MLSDEQNRIIEKVAREIGFENFSISVEPGSKKGDNYLGTIWLIKIKEKNASKEKSLILKCAETMDAVRAQMPINKFYEREVFMYTTVLPQFAEFQEKYGMKHPFKAFAKLYEYCLEEKKEFLLFENIRERGFKMYDRKATMDDSHVATVFREFGKLHSISLAMKHLEPDKYKLLTDTVYDLFAGNKDIEKVWKENTVKRFKNVYKAVEGMEEATEAVRKCEKDIMGSMEELLDKKNEIVIVHGDGWCNNMMFKYEDVNNPNKPTELCFLDWQISKQGSPVTELSYFFFPAASKQALTNHKQYLNQYYQIIEENLKSTGCDSDTVFSRDLLDNLWKKYCKIGMLIAMGNLEFLLRKEEDAQTFSDMAGDGKEIFAELFNSQNFSDEYFKRLKDIVIMLVENKYL